MSYTDHNHGHVFKRPDRATAKCGGPGICSTCARDQAQWDARIFGTGFLSVDADGKLKRVDPETVMIKPSAT